MVSRLYALDIFVGLLVVRLVGWQVGKGRAEPSMR